MLRMAQVNQENLLPENDNLETYLATSEEVPNSKAETDDDEEVVYPSHHEGGWGWVVVVAVWLIYLLTCGMSYSLTLFYQAMLNHYKQTPTKTAWVFSLHNLFRMLTGPAVSLLCSHVSHRKVLVFGSLLNFVGMVVSAYAPSIEVMYLSYGIISGFCGSLQIVASLGIVTMYFDKKRGRAIAIVMSGCGIGGMIFPPLIDTLLAHYGFSGGLLLFAGLNLHCLVAATLCRTHDFPQNRGKTSNEEDVDNTHNGQHETLSSVEDQRHSIQFLPRIYKISSMESQYNHDMKDDIMPLHLRLGNNNREINFRSLPCLVEADAKISIQNKSETSSLKDINFLDRHKRLSHSVADQLRSDTREIKKSSPVHVYSPSDDGDSHISQPNRLYSILEFAVVHLGFNLMLSADIAFLFVAVCGYYSCFVTVNTMLSGQAAELGVSTFKVALIIMIANAGNAILLPIIGFAFDTHFVRTRKDLFYFMTEFIISMLVIFIPVVNTETGLFIVTIPCYTLMDAIFSLNMIYVTSLVKPSEGTRAIGLMRFVMGITGFVAPPVGASLTDLTGTYSTAFFFAGSTCLLSAFTFLAFNIVKRNKSRGILAAKETYFGE